ncbi:hypothetical protein GPECTOR_1g69 [Gonium pectorale]|uniref:Uncharacterized protein n=1 Tax=Gonium pectorale TaxID=33097 RepID=A0A150H406_GONPE|nr:hypothetical protein GPECTOR_1g69 [Gonium pectorale]|eukprot:KXZ56765.1 hypothetical protein GPECTOR_1g69 [Gonium pectorale]
MLTMLCSTARRTLSLEGAYAAGSVSVWRFATTAAAAGPQRQQQQQQKKLGLKDVQHIIAITSAKGGVGKSTTAGPSPLMLPKENYRVKTMSFGFFLEGDEPVVWRGPMVNNAFDKMLFGTDWGPLDVLVVDMPPGTGDAQINLGQRIPLSGAALVSTPQDVALIDVRRGAQMFLKMRVPLLGLVENMSYHTCSKCGHVEHIFGSGGAQRVAQEYGLEVLGQAKSDAGTPVVASDPRGALAAAYTSTAQRLLARLKQTESAATAGPTITVE